VIVVSDESGDDGDPFLPPAADQLENALAVLKTHRSPIYILGRESVFGNFYAYVRWKHPQTGYVHRLPIRRGPEAPSAEQLLYDGFRRRFDSHMSGFGPYEQVRLARDSGGIFFQLPHEEENLNDFKKKQFSMALFSDHTFHMSMMAVVTLVPILVENGLGYDPIVASWVLIPGQCLGIFLPLIAGYYFDKSKPRWIRPGGLLAIASGFVMLALFSGQVPIWVLPMLLIPAFIGTHTFNAPSNAMIMNSLPEDRSFASGVMETSRQMGHTIGATIAATMLGLALPASISFMTDSQAEPFYQTGFQYAATAVIFTMMAGALVAAFQEGLIRRPFRNAIVALDTPSPADD